jgi:phosphoribosylanthranilate isomerase
MRELRHLNLSNRSFTGVWVKICGIRDLETATAVAALGPDAIGLNFYGPSPRVVEVKLAVEIVRNLPGSVEPVGVFVNHSVDEVTEICERCSLRIAQVHGDESPQFLAELQSLSPSLKIIRALRLGPAGPDKMTAYLSKCQDLGVKLFACLVDALSNDVYGGSGKTVAWEQLAPDQRAADWPPIILAGGLKPTNVAEAIAAVRPWGVDVASGVETSPGVKDLAAIKGFIESARSKI